MIYDAAPSSLATVLVNSTVLAVLQWSVIEHAVIVIWLAAVWLISALRMLMTLRFRRAQPDCETIESWAAWVTGGALASGLSWGAASVFLFASESLPHQMFLALVIAGMAAGAVTTLSALRWAAIGFVCLSTLPLLYRFSQEAHAFAGAMSLLIVLFTLMMIPVINRFYRNLTEMLTERYERQRAQRHDRTRNRVLEMVAKGAALSQVLKEVVVSIEREHPDMLCSVLLLDDSGRRLLMGAAPSLPDSYNAAIHGAEIGPTAGSCGTAAHRRERVIVEDIQTHALWEGYRDLAALAGLRACWSEPIFAASGKVLGTFAIYHREAYSPSADELGVIEHAANLAGVAIERSRADEALQLAALVYQNSSEAMMITDEDNNIVAINPAFSEMTGYALEEVIGKNPHVLSSGRQNAAFYKSLWSSLHTTGQWQGEIWNRRKNGEEFAEWLTKQHFRRSRRRAAAGSAVL